MTLAKEERSGRRDENEEKENENGNRKKTWIRAQSLPLIFGAVARFACDRRPRDQEPG